MNAIGSHSMSEWEPHPFVPDTERSQCRRCGMVAYRHNGNLHYPNQVCLVDGEPWEAYRCPDCGEVFATEDNSEPLCPGCGKGNSVLLSVVEVQEVGPDL